MVALASDAPLANQLQAWRERRGRTSPVAVYRYSNTPNSNAACGVDIIDSLKEESQKRPTYSPYIQSVHTVRTYSPYPYKEYNITGGMNLKSLTEGLAPILDPSHRAEASEVLKSYEAEPPP